MSSVTPYFVSMSTLVAESKRDDPIDLEPIVLTPGSHPRSVFSITLRDSRDSNRSKRAYFKHLYSTMSLLEYVRSRKASGRSLLLPDTMDPDHPICKNNESRLLMYAEAMTKFRDTTFDELGLVMSDDGLTSTPAKITQIIDDFFTKPRTSESIDKFRFFTTYVDIIRYLNNGILYDRETTSRRLENSPVKTVILRESSYGKYNNDTEEFFAVTIKGATGNVNYVYCHRKGYGIFEANSYVVDCGTFVIFDEVGKGKYYPCIADLIFEHEEVGRTFYISSQAVSSCYA